ncbi:MAG: tRNA uridine-5-carboxymethylaminomethyl(34) synthesis GTPase MnmE [Firmicutes bacterium]|nr:tRNA uridine-5-carboxymethylaminomethyl(34) synthesis GTPase MnmE [Bacillota bacterium]
MMNEDTICAIATPPGESGIGIIRISGPDARKALLTVFRPAKGHIKERELTYGKVCDPETGELIDEVLAVYFPAPKTYTCEDVAEIDCHGGAIPLSRTLSLLLRQGVRLAEPGEFTKRAFLNGRLDLSQAEAVMDVIGAKTEAASRAALDQLQGRFSEEIRKLRQSLTDALVEIGVNIDYPDEDIEELTYQHLLTALRGVRSGVEGLLASAEAGRIVRDGLKVAIVGRPNAGKSSLMNGLLRENRAIVTAIPGTTRDTIEEFANLRGIPVLLTDTAGIRETEDEVERLGIDRSRKSLAEADLVIVMIDAAEAAGGGKEAAGSAAEAGQAALIAEERQLLASVPAAKTLCLFNKADQAASVSQEDLLRVFPEAAGCARVLYTSVLTPEGIKACEDAIFDLSGAGGENPALPSSRGAGNLITANARHRAMLAEAREALLDAEKGVEAGLALEFLEIDVRRAYEALGFITGDSVQDDIIKEIFSRFCLGK